MAPKKRQSLALSRRKIEAERVSVQLRTTQRIAQLICRRRQELRVSAERLAWLFEYILFLSYPIVREPSLLSVAIPKEYVKTTRYAGYRAQYSTGPRLR